MHLTHVHLHNRVSFIFFIREILVVDLDSAAVLIILVNGHGRHKGCQIEGGRVPTTILVVDEH